MAILSEIERTLLLPLYGRYVLSKNNSIAFNDKTSLKLFDKLKAQGLVLSAKLNQVECCYFLDRALMLDQTCGDFLQKHPLTNVVHVGAGLDDVFARNDNGAVLWYDLDVPDVIDLRSQYLTTHARQTLISSSVFDIDWIEQIDTSLPTLVLCPGVLNYFELPKVMELLDELARRIPKAQLLMDVMSDYLSLYAANLTVSKANAGRAELKWVINKNTTAWPESIQKITFKPFYQHIPPSAKLHWLTKLTINWVRQRRYLQYCHLNF